MGRSITPRFRIEHEGGDCVPHFWNHRDRPTSDKLFMLLCTYQLSCEPGQANEHIGERLGRTAKLPRAARVVDQTTGKVVAAWES